MLSHKYFFKNTNILFYNVMLIFVPFNYIVTINIEINLYA